MADSVYNSVSCLYDALDLGNSGQWLEDGTLILNRPPASTKLDKLKFRSFSANIKNNIANITAPTLNCSLCCNFEILNQTTTSPDKITDEELSSKPKLLNAANGLSSSYSLNVLNQTGFKSYNNLYGTNVIKLSEFSIPLNLSVEDSISNGLRRAKIEFMKIMGLLADESNDKDNFDYLSFQYGNYGYQLQQFTQPLNPLNSFAFVNTYNYSTSGQIQIIPKQLDNFVMYNYSTANKTFETAVTKKLNMYGVNYPNNPSYYMLMTTNEQTLADTFHFYHLPDTYGYYALSKPDTFVTTLDLTSDASYNKFIAKANYGLVLSSSSGQDEKGFLWVAMSSNDCLNRPSFYAASLQRMLYNPDEFKMYGFGYNPYPNFKLFDYSNYLTNYLNTIQSLGCPTTAFFVKFDAYIVYIPPNKNTYINVFYFMDVNSDTKTFYVYTFKGVQADCVSRDTYLLSNPTLVSRYSISFNDTTDLNIYGSDYNKWNNMIDTYFGGHGMLAVNFGSIRGLFAIDIIRGAQWCPFDNYLTTTQGQVTCNTFGDGYSGGQYVVLSKVIYNATSNNDIICKVWRAGSNPYDIYNPSAFYTIPASNIQKVLGNYNLTNSNPLQRPNYFTMLVADFSSQGSYDAKNSIMFSAEIDSNLNSYYYSDLDAPVSGIRYTLSNSMLNISTWNGTFVPYLPTINEYGNTDGYNWCKPNHISPDSTSSFQYTYYNANTDKGQTYAEFLNSIFNWDINANTITFPNIPVYQQGSENTIYGVLLFYITFNTSPDVISFDPNIKQGIRSFCASYYSTYKQVLRHQPSLYINTYNFDPYFVILDENYYNALNTYLALRSTDQTLKLICDSYPTLNNIVFYLNETSMIDFKESTTSPMEPNIKCRIVDAAGATVTPAIANQIYSNITICVDWQFYV